MSLLVTCASSFVVVVGFYYMLLFGISLTRHRANPNGRLPRAFVIFVAALNEEQVIARTIESLLRMDHDRFVICVGDDDSSDATPEILARYADDPRVCVLRRAAPRARVGKSDVLNQCLEETMRLVGSSHPVLGGTDPADIVVGIVDADGRLDNDCLRRVEPYFCDPHVGGVQIGVRIANARTNLLTRMQDMEFVGFSGFVQRARDRIGSCGLGGNGQFNRLSALLELKATRGGPWKTDALTEDLELGLALVCLGWRTRYCPNVYVAQQGLPGWRALFRQRTRWIQGHYRCWSYLPKLMRSPASWLTRMDLSLYLLLIIMVLIATFNAVVSVLMFAHVTEPENALLALLPAGTAQKAISLTLGISPLVMFMYVYQRNAADRFRFWEIPAAGFLLTLYTYVWVFATIRALARNVIGRDNWVKTPRVAEAASAVESPAVTGA